MFPATSVPATGPGPSSLALPSTASSQRVDSGVSGLGGGGGGGLMGGYRAGGGGVAATGAGASGGWGSGGRWWSTVLPGGSMGGGGGGSTWWGRYLRRAASPSQWDVEYAVFQLLLAVLDPHKLYKLTQHRKQSKNTWSRDDPAFTMVLFGLVAVTMAAFGVAYGYATSPLLWLYCVVVPTAWQAAGGMAVAAGLWHAVNRWGRTAVPAPHSVEQRVELLYAWDVHTNAAVPLYACHLVLLYLLAPLAMADHVAATLLANTIWMAGCVAYLYVTFWGYAVLPFLQSERIKHGLLAVPAVVLVGVLASVVNFNIPRYLWGFTVA